MSAVKQPATADLVWNGEWKDVLEELLPLPVLNKAARSAGIPLDSTDTTFYVDYETIVVEDETNINRIPEAIFSYLNRNALHDEEHYGVPIDQIVEIGSQLRV